MRLWLWLLAACATTGRGTEPEAPEGSAAAVTSSQPTPREPTALPAGRVSFNPKDGHLVHASETTLAWYGPERTPGVTVTLPAKIEDLRHATDGVLWVIDLQGVQRFVGTEVGCRTEEIAPTRIVETDGETVRVLRATYMDGVGVHAEVHRIDADCTVTAEPLEPRMPWVAVSAGGHRWLALDAPQTLTSGSSASASLARDADPPVWILTGTEDAIAALAVTDTHAFVVARDGAWEMWQTGQSASQFSGSGATTRAVTVPDSTYIAVGRDRFDLATGVHKRDAFPGAIHAMSSDGSEAVWEAAGGLLWGSLPETR